LLVLQKAFKLPELQNEKQVQRIAWSHCYRSSAYTFYAAGRYREAINRLRLSIQHWPYAYRPADEVPSWYRSRLFLGIMKRWLFSSTKA
ncbi:MAG TPA: hypothetical protein PKD72_00375, partial [Gemmatales bacterium]|nr:hypothetical protein [Gemmatales bacterium]